jgi:hypothetical protein
MDPFLRPATRFGATAKPTPDGWTSVTIGRWNGRPAAVVYDPCRHDVTVVRGRVPVPVMAAVFASAGWTMRGSDEASEWWMRDRVAHARIRLDRRAASGRGIALLP